MGEVKIPYKGAAFETYDALASKLGCYSSNIVYKASVNGNIFFFYINNKGFLHILKAERVVMHSSDSKKYSLFEVSDYLLTSSNTLRYKGKVGNYCNSARDANAAIFKLLGNDIRDF